MGKFSHLKTSLKTSFTKLKFNPIQIAVMVVSILAAISAFLYYLDHRRPDFKTYEQIYQKPDDIQKVDMLAGYTSQAFQPMDEQLGGQQPEDIIIPEDGTPAAKAFDNAMTEQQKAVAMVNKDKQDTKARGGIATVEELDAYYKPNEVKDKVLAQNVQEQIATQKGQPFNNKSQSASSTAPN